MQGGNVIKRRMIGSAFVAAIAALACVSCSSSSATTKSVSVGEAVNFNGSGEKITMTVDKIADPADSAEGTQPPAGYRNVAVEFKVANNGTSTYTDDPGKATLIDSHGTSYHPVQVLPEVVMDAISDKNSESSDIPAGDSAIGAVVFQVPVTAKTATVQLADHGTGQKGQWKAS